MFWSQNVTSLWQIDLLNQYSANEMMQELWQSEVDGRKN